jgi:hypothetical protein
VHRICTRPLSNYLISINSLPNPSKDENKTAEPGHSRDIAAEYRMLVGRFFRRTKFASLMISSSLDRERYGVTIMSKTKFTEADVRRAVRGVIDGGGTVASVDIWPDGRISVTIKGDKHRSIDPEDDPEVSRRLL